MTMGTILRHIQPSVDFAKVIDRHYVRLVEPGSVLGLPAAPFLKDPVIREVRGAPASARPRAGPHGGSAVATNGLLHQQVLSRLRGA